MTKKNMTFCKSLYYMKSVCYWNTDKTIDKTHLLVASENNIEFLTNALPWTPFEPAKQFLTLLLETVKFLGKDILTNVEIEIES